MPYIPRAVCGLCDRAMKPYKNGQTLEAVLNNGRSYYKIDADEYRCPSCNHSIFINFAQEAIQSHDPRYDRIHVDHPFSLESR